MFGGAHIWAAALLRGHKPFGRILMLALALANLLVIPFGTALGVYAMWVLLKNDAHRLFDPGCPARRGGPSGAARRRT